MSKTDVKSFYKAAVAQKEFNSDFWNEVKEISTEDELETFIEEKVQPVAKKMGYDFSTKDLLDYEKQMARKITEQQLEAVSGGASAKSWALGGIFSLMALGAGIAGTTSSASAELTTKDVAQSTGIMETAIAKKFENPKILPIQDEKEIEGVKKDEETSQASVDEYVTISAKKSMTGNWIYLTTGSDSTEALNLTLSKLETFSKEAGFNNISEIQAIQAKNAKGQVLDVKLDASLGTLWETWGKANAKKDTSDVDAEQTVAETHDLGAEQSTADGSDLRPEQVTSDISVLETAKAAVNVDSKEVFEIPKLTDEQQLYAYEALNLQEAYALLKSGVVENVRFCGDIKEIETVNGNRRYTADKGDAFTELLYMLYPSPAGDLNTYTGFKGRDSFAIYGGMSPEIAAKFFAILNDYRNNKIKIPKEFENVTLRGIAGKVSFSYVNPEFIKVLAWLKEKGLLTAEVEALENAIKEAEELKKSVDSTDINRFNLKKTYIKSALKSKKTIAGYFDGEIEKLKKRNATETIEIIEKLKEYNEKELKNELENIDIENKLYNVNFSELNKKAKSIESSKIAKEAKFLMHFINIMKEAADLEVTDGSSYPKYLTEYNLMSYMCQILNNLEAVQKLYHEIAEQLSRNETNKTPTPEAEKAAIAKKIAAKKAEIARLNGIINEAKFQVLSPYKSATQSNGVTYQIGTIGEDGNVQIQANTFADCADIAARHVINLLTFANDKNWNSILNEANIDELDELNVKLKEVVDAIENKSPVKFYDLKTRLQMFFLYQRGFIDGDDEENRKYRGANGADDVTPLARTLWEYVICNMNAENLEKGPDKEFYSIAYVNGKNHELEPGYINMLKLMWNMASALNLKSETLSSVKEKINYLIGQRYDGTKFKDALSSTFSLFYTDEIEFELSGCEYENINGNNEIVGAVTVNITKDGQKLNFKISHISGHAVTRHSPIDFDLKEFEEHHENIDLNDFEKLLLRNFTKGSLYYKSITPPGGFLGAFSEEKLEPGDTFINKDLNKKCKALSAFKILQGERNNIARINNILDIETMEGAKKINVIQDGKRQGSRDLSDILYERYLKPH